MDKAETKPKRGQDKTRTPRQEKYLERLDAAKGKRLVVDLSAEGNEALEGLLGSGYGSTQKAVVDRALADAFAREKKKKKA